MKKKLLSVFFILFMLSFMPVIANAAESGTCGANGDNLTWTLDDNGTLTISGQGEMYDYSYGESPWWDREIKKVTINSGVTSIGDWAFYSCNSLTSITIPDSVTSIDWGAFSDCTGLISITIPDSVTSIGEYAFHDCSGLTSITIPDNVTSIDYSVFLSCTGLKSVTIPDSVTNIGGRAFCDCTGLRDVYYSGTEDEWNEISISYDNDELTSARIHYNSTGPVKIQPTKAEVVKTDTEDAWRFDVSVQKTYEYSYVYAAIYDAAGGLIKIEQVPLEMTGSTSVSIGKSNDAVRAKVFVWAYDEQPITYTEIFDL